MQCVGKIEALTGEINGLGKNGWASGLDVGKAEQFGEGIADGGRLEAVGEPQYPLGFEDYGLGDENGLACKQGGSLLELLLVVAGEQPDHDIGINRDHCAAP